MQTVCLLVIAGAICAAGLYLLQPVMIPLAMALLLTYVLEPVVEFSVARLRFPRSLAIITSMVLAIGVTVGFGFLISISIEDLLSSGEMYQRRLLELATEFGLPVARAEVPLAAEPSLAADAFRELPLRQWATGLADSMVDAATNFLLILVFACYMLMGTAGTPRGDRDDSLRRQVAFRVKRYLIIKLLLSALTGLLVGVSLQIIGVELALLFGVLTFVLNFIPNIGSVIATLLPLPVVLFNPEYTTTTFMLVLFIPGTIQFVIGNVVEPMMIGGELHLHPVAVLAALVFWGVLWGAPGLLLAVPLTAALRIAAESMELTRPVARLLEGKLDYLDGADEYLPASGTWSRPPLPPRPKPSGEVEREVVAAAVENIAAEARAAVAGAAADAAADAAAQVTAAADAAAQETAAEDAAVDAAVADAVAADAADAVAAHAASVRDTAKAPAVGGGVEHLEPLRDLAIGGGDRPTLKTSMAHVLSDPSLQPEPSTLAEGSPDVSDDARSTTSADGSPRREHPTLPGLPPKSAV